MKDFKETMCVMIYCILFIPWLFLTIVYKPIDRLMRYSAQFIDDKY